MTIFRIGSRMLGIYEVFQQHLTSSKPFVAGHSQRSMLGVDENA